MFNLTRSLGLLGAAASTSSDEPLSRAAPPNARGRDAPRRTPAGWRFWLLIVCVLALMPIIGVALPACTADEYQTRIIAFNQKLDAVKAQKAKIDSVLMKVDEYGDKVDTFVGPVIPEQYRDIYDAYVGKGVAAVDAAAKISAALGDVIQIGEEELAKLNAALDAAKASDSEKINATLAVIGTGASITDKIITGGVASAIVGVIATIIGRFTNKKAKAKGFDAGYTEGQSDGASAVVRSVQVGRELDKKLDAAFRDMDGSTKLAMHDKLEVAGVREIVADSKLGPSRAA